MFICVLLEISSRSFVTMSLEWFLLIFSYESWNDSKEKAYFAPIASTSPEISVI